MIKYTKERKEQGFTLIELLIAIVVVGILAAVAIVGIGGLTNTGGKSACKASADAAKAASAAWYANNGNKWPSTLSDLTGASPKVFEEPTGHVDADTATGGTMTVGSWTMTMTNANAAGTNQPIFDSTC
jgi:prepilin-type N-terminal cleavage/methylation domain-containing protein